MSNLADEIVESPRDEKLAAIIKEIRRYINTPVYERRRAKDRQELQEY